MKRLNSPEGLQERKRNQILSGYQDGWLITEYWDGQPMYEVAYWKDGDVVDGWIDTECFISHYDDNKLGAEQWLQDVINLGHIEEGV
jgi:hypothetical protein